MSDKVQEATRWYSLTPEAAAQQLSVDPAKGLTAAEAQKRLGQYGGNELAEKKKEPGWRASRKRRVCCTRPRTADPPVVAHHDPALPTCAAAICRTGTSRVKTLPDPRRLSTVTRPPCCSAIDLTMASPRPEPRSRDVSAPRAR